MIIDTSAVIAMIDEEPCYRALLDAIAEPHEVALSAATYVEIHAVTSRRGDATLGRRADRLLESMNAEVAPFDHAQAQIAARAYREYGRGSGHPAGLNLGDCYAYALAMHRDQPLLFVGADFTHTDVKVALRA